MLNWSPCDSGMKVLRSLKDGWLDGDGKAPSSEFLDWLEPLIPAQALVYPTPGGGVSLEWRIGRRDISLNIEPAKAGAYHDYNHETDALDYLELDMSKPESWAEIMRRVNER